jgi:hypothetical protein
MAETTLTARVDETGHLPLQVRRRITTLLLRHKGHDVTLTLTRTAPARSTSANRRYWSMLHVAARSLGYDNVNDLHDGLALRLLRVDDDPVLGTPRRTSTASLDSAAFVAYSDAAMRLLIEFGADLSDWDRAEPA